MNKWLNAKDVDLDELWSKIDGVIIKTVLAAYPVLKHSYHACFSTHDKTSACFELLGFDILLDWKLKPYLLEVSLEAYNKENIIKHIHLLYLYFYKTRMHCIKIISIHYYEI